MEIAELVKSIIEDTLKPDKVHLERNSPLTFRIYWYLPNNEGRKHKQSKNILISISEEYFDDSLQNKNVPAQFKAGLTTFLKSKSSTLNKESNHTINQPAPQESWVFCG